MLQCNPDNLMAYISLLYISLLVYRFLLIAPHGMNVVQGSDPASAFPFIVGNITVDGLDLFY